MNWWRAHPYAPPVGTVLCGLADVPLGGVREVAFGPGLDGFRILVVRTQAYLRAYRNLCPHYRIPLNVRPDEFIVVAGEEIWCANHSAVFRLADGYCVDGPCKEASLEPIPVDVRDGSIRLGTPA